MKTGNYGTGKISRTKTRRHEGKTESVFLCVCRRIQTLTQCIIFISFMSFMVRMAVLCGFVTLCEKWSRNDGLVLHSSVQDVQNGEIGVLIPQSRDQSEDWRIAGVLKFEKAGKQNR